MGSHWIDVTNNKTYQCVDNSTGAASWCETSAGESGDIVIQGSSTVEATTTQTTPWNTMKTINLSVLKKKYLVHWTLQYGNDIKDKITYVRAQIDNTVTLMDIKHEGKPDNWYMVASGTYPWDNTGGTAGSKPFDLDGYTESGGTTQVKEFIMALEEVSY